MEDNFKTPLHHHLFLHGYAHKGTTIGSDKSGEDPKGAPAPQGDTCREEQILLPALRTDHSQVASGGFIGGSAVLRSWSTALVENGGMEASITWASGMRGALGLLPV